MSTLRSTRRELLKGAAALGTALAVRPSILGAQDMKTVRIRSKTDIRSIDTARNYSIADFDVRQAVLNNLILYKPGDAWTWQHDAVEYIEQVDPTHTAFRLRPGIMWTNGYGEMTAEDVKYSYERLTNPELEATDYQEFEQFSEVTVTDKYSGVIVTKSPVANLWTNTLPRAMGSIICKKAWEERNGWATPLDNDIPCSSGPYKLKEWIPQSKVVLERNDLWNGPEAYFDNVEYILIEDENTAEIAYLAGELDIAWVSVGSGADFVANPPPNTDVLVRPTTGFTWVGINVDHEPFDDIRVRKAVRHAINVREIIDAAYFGLTQPSTGIIAPGLLGHREAEVPAPDLDAARALLAEAGLSSGFKTSITTLNNTTELTAAQVIQANLAEIGIEVEIKPYEGGVYWTLGLESEGDAWKDLEMVYQEWTSSPDPRRATMWFVPDQVGVWNWSRWNNAEYGDLDMKASIETDLDKRATLYSRMMDVMHEEAAFLGITYPPRVTLVRDHIDPQMLPNGYVYARMVRLKGA
jgi:peptide/nickel transport system substrate-binding protein